MTGRSGRSNPEPEPRTAAARAQADSGGCRSAEGRRRAIPVHAAAARPAEIDFKRAYARYALAAGLTREQAVRVYSFETGGNGNHDMQSGLSASRPGSRAISTAIGYNQLLTTNSVELLAEQGHEFVKALTAKAATLSGAPRKAMDHKLAVLKRMVAFSRTGAGHLVRAREARQYRRRAGRCTPWCWTSTSARCCRPTSC